MNKKKCYHHPLCLCLMVLLVTASQLFGSEKIVFSEVLYDSIAPNDTEGEWFELYNPQPTSIDIGNWTISDNATTYTIPSGTVIYSKSYLVIAYDKDTFVKYYRCTPQLIQKVLRLNNSGDYLILKNINGKVIDTVAWENKGKTVLGWDSSTATYANAGKSIRRTNLVLDTDSYTDWSNDNQPSPFCGEFRN